MIKKAILLHDSYTTTTIGWYATLAPQFEALGITVFIPKFPTPVGESYASWKAMLVMYSQHFGPETIFIGHGTGSLFALRLLEEISMGGAILVSPYMSRVSNEGINMVSTTFFPVSFDWKKIHQNCPHFSVIASTQDPIIPLEESKRVSDLCGAFFIEKVHEGHMLGEVSDLPELVSALNYLNNPTKEETTTNIHNLVDQLAHSGITLSIPEEGVVETPHVDDDSYVSSAEVPKERDYYQDVSKTITSGEAGTMATLLREEREKEELKVIKKSLITKNVIFGFLGCVVLVVGVYFLMGTKRSFVVPLESVKDPAPLQAEYSTVAELKNDKAAAILKLEQIIKEANAEHNTFTLVTPASEKGQPLGFIDFMNLIQAKAPTELRGSVTAYLYGFYQLDRKEPFLIMSVNSFDNGFDGLKKWEPTITLDLYRTLVRSDRGFTRESLEAPVFEDIELSNKHMRQALLNRKELVKKVVPREEVYKEKDLPQTYIYDPSWNGTVGTSAIGFKTVLPTEMKNIKTKDLIAMPAIGKSNQEVRIVDSVELTSEVYVIKTRTASVDEAFAATQITSTYTKRVGADGDEYVKTWNDEKEELVDGTPEVGLVTGFINDSVFVVTTNPEVLEALVKRLADTSLLKRVKK